MEKCVTICGLRLSKSWKSSFFKSATACPVPSRTTTRTRTRFTGTLNVAVDSCVLISATGSPAAFVSCGVVVGDVVGDDVVVDDDAGAEDDCGSGAGCGAALEFGDGGAEFGGGVDAGGVCARRGITIPAQQSQSKAERMA